MHTYVDANIMINDDCPINRIMCYENVYQVGWNGVTEILIYHESGEMGYVNYAAVYKGDFLFARVDLKGWVVEYQKAKTP